MDSTGSADCSSSPPSAEREESENDGRKDTHSSPSDGDVSDAIKTEPPKLDPPVLDVDIEEKSINTVPDDLKRRESVESEEVKKVDPQEEEETHNTSNSPESVRLERKGSVDDGKTRTPSDTSPGDPSDSDNSSPCQTSQPPDPPPRGRKRSINQNETGFVNEAYESDESDQNKLGKDTSNNRGKEEESKNQDKTKTKNISTGTPSVQNEKSPGSLEDSQEEKGVRLRKELSLLDCVGIIVGNIIGSGIFVAPRAVLNYTGSVGMSLVVWVVSGLVAIIGALCFAEMGAMIPQSGGNYTYLHEAFGPLPAFLYVWMLVTIGIPGSRAIGALTFSNYLLQPFFPVGQEPPQSALRLVAICLILLLTYINTRKVKWATTVQDVMAVLKVFALVVIILVGLYHLASGRTSHYDNAFENTNWNPTFIATAFYHTLYAYDGWDSLNMIMEELKNPIKNMPRAITISLTTVIVVYILTNVSYFAVLNQEQMLASPAVAVTFGQLALGSLSWIIPILVACSSSGALNGSLFGSSRLLYVTARRGQLPRVISFVHVRNNTPVIALVFAASISMVMFVTSDVTILINYLSFAGNLVGLFCIASFFYFRIKHPDLHRPIKVWIGFPILSAILSVFLTIFPVIRQPIEVLAAVIIIGTGLPVYYFLIHREEKPKALIRVMDKVTYLCQLLFLSVPEEKED